MAICLLLMGCDRAPAAYDAVRAGDPRLLARALDAGADPDARSHEGWPPLVEAAYAGRDDLVAQLLAHGATIDATNSNGFSALGEAAREGHDPIVARLLAAHADIAVADKRMKRTALLWAIAGGHVASVAALLKSGAKPSEVTPGGETPLLTAINAHHVGVVRLLLRAGADPNLSVRRGELLTVPLESAAANDGDTSDIVKELLIAGAAVDGLGWRDNTALIAAAQHGNVKCAQILIDHGAPVNSVGGFYARSPLSWAIANHHAELAALLRQHDAIAIDRRS